MPRKGAMQALLRKLGFRRDAAKKEANDASNEPLTMEECLALKDEVIGLIDRVVPDVEWESIQVLVAPGGQPEAAVTREERRGHIPIGIVRVAVDAPRLVGWEGMGKEEEKALFKAIVAHEIGHAVLGYIASETDVTSDWRANPFDVAGKRLSGAARADAEALSIASPMLIARPPRF